MKKYYLLFFIIAASLFSCKGKKNKPEDSAISVISIIKGQLHHLDTSFYQIMKFTSSNGVNDSAYLKREDVKEYAKGFLEIPDIAEKKLLNQYTEERIIDESQNTLSITYTAKDENMEIQKEIIIVNIDDLASGKVQSIYIDRFLPEKDSSVQQHLFWQMDKFFQIGESIQKENSPELTRTSKIVWK